MTVGALERPKAVVVGKEAIAIPRRQSPTRAYAKSESKKRHMKLRRLYGDKPRSKESGSDAMDFCNTGSSPPLLNRACTVLRSPVIIRQAPFSLSSSGAPVSQTPSITLSPTIPGKEVTMGDTPPSKPSSIKLNVKQQTTPSHSAGKSSTSKAYQPTSAFIPMEDTPQQHGPSPLTSQPSAPFPPAPKPISTAEEARALIPPGGITSKEFMARAGLANYSKEKRAQLKPLILSVATFQGGKLFPKSLGNIGVEVKKEGAATTDVSMKSPVTPTPSALTAGAGYSKSSKACQPLKRTSSQAAQRPSAPLAGKDSTVFVTSKPKPKKQTPTPGLSILFKQANAAGQRSTPKTPQLQVQTTIPGLTLLSQASNGPRPVPNLFPPRPQTTKPSHQPSVQDMDEDEEL